MTCVRVCATVVFSLLQIHTIGCLDIRERGRDRVWLEYYSGGFLRQTLGAHTTSNMLKWAQFWFLPTAGLIDSRSADAVHSQNGEQDPSMLAERRWGEVRVKTGGEGREGRERVAAGLIYGSRSVPKHTCDTNAQGQDRCRSECWVAARHAHVLQFTSTLHRNKQRKSARQITRWVQADTSLFLREFADPVPRGLERSQTRRAQTGWGIIRGGVFGNKVVIRTLFVQTGKGIIHISFVVIVNFQFPWTHLLNVLIRTVMVKMIRPLADFGYFSKMFSIFITFHILKLIPRTWPHFGTLWKIQDFFMKKKKKKKTHCITHAYCMIFVG